MHDHLTDKKADAEKTQLINGRVLIQTHVCMTPNPILIPLYARVSALNPFPSFLYITLLINVQNI